MLAGKQEIRDAHALLHVAVEKIKQNQFATARLDLENALRIAAEEPLVLSFYGLCLAQLGEVGRGGGVLDGVGVLRSGAGRHDTQAYGRVSPAPTGAAPR